MRQTTNKTKFHEKRGSGTGADYKPWIKASEFSSSGTSSAVLDYKTGRMMQLLSYGELYFWYLLMWLDPIEIKEQYPLDRKQTLKIAENLGLQHPFTKDGCSVMTTDFYVIFNDARTVAYSIKSNSDLDKRTKEKLLIEKHYWNNLGVEWKFVAKDTLKIKKANNIRICSYFYNYEGQDNISVLKRLIIRKIITVDMESNLNFKELTSEFKKEIDYQKCWWK